MSMQAGVWHHDQKPVSPETVKAIEDRMAIQGPDSCNRFEQPGFAMLYRAFHITDEDALEVQPLRTAHGSVLTWDGRLDNRNEILQALGRSAIDLPTDAEIASAALAAWDSKALPMFIGDWALAYWQPEQRRLLLARDYIGIRTLFYLATQNSLFWATDLAALVLHSGERFSLCDEYFAGFFTSNPEPHLTPYDEIKFVPPGGYLEVTPSRLRVRRYWSFNSNRAIRYRCDEDYEEHFRHLFRQSVRRRLRTAYPILADLSGGLDSSSIVCMAYDVLKEGEASATINTLSYYSLEEPGGDERPYVEVVERHIGKRGTHIETRLNESATFTPLREPYFSGFPDYFDGAIKGEEELLRYTGQHGNRVRFKGLGGDELLGGMQNPVPELASLLWHFRWPTFARQLTAWASQRKTTVWSLMGQASIYLAPIWIRECLIPKKDLVAWIRPEFARRQHVARRKLQAVTDWRAHLPGLPSPDSGYLSLAGTLAGYVPPFSYADQWTLSYYDRDLVAFLFAVPDEQILRPQQRRSLMRRGLKGIVPEKILMRKTKWLGRRQPTLGLLDKANSLMDAMPGAAIVDRYVDSVKIETDFEKLRQGKEVPLVLFERLLQSCFFFHHLAGHGLWQSLSGLCSQQRLRSTMTSARLATTRIKGE